LFYVFNVTNTLQYNNKSCIIYLLNYVSVKTVHWIIELHILLSPYTYFWMMFAEHEIELLDHLSPEDRIIKYYV